MDTGMKRFLFKLISPRRTFPQDMTEAERNVMREHVSHWTELAEKRTAIVFGPVIDPTQVWGVAIVEVEDESEARALVQDDPVTKAGLGRIGIYPMGPSTIVRD